MSWTKERGKWEGEKPKDDKNDNLVQHHQKGLVLYKIVKMIWIRISFSNLTLKASVRTNKPRNETSFCLPVIAPSSKHSYFKPSHSFLHLDHSNDNKTPIRPEKE